MPAPADSISGNITWTRTEQGILTPDTDMITTHAQAVNTVDDEAVLFSFDDASWPFVQGGRIVLERPAKHPANPLLRRGGKGAPDEMSARLGGTVLIEDGKFRMWYIGTRLYGSHPEDIDFGIDDLPFYQRNRKFPKIQSLCYAQSDDGIHWTKPDLGERFNALTTDNHEDNASFVLKNPEGDGYIFCVADFPESRDDGDRYKLKAFNGPIRIYQSPDGIRLDPISDGDDLPMAFEGGSFFYFQGRYFAGGHGNGPAGPRVGAETEPPNKRTMLTLMSRSWREWPAGACAQPFMDGFGAIENHGGVACTPRGNVCLGMTGRFVPGEGNYRAFSANLGFAISNDGLHWREPVPNGVYVDHDQEKGWDPDWPAKPGEGTFLRQSYPILTVGDETWMYYAATTMGGNTNYRNYQVGLMTIPRDRFGYLERIVWDPSKSTTHDYTTMDIHFDGITAFSCPIECTGNARLLLNYAVTEGTKPVTVALRDEDRMQALPGYTHDACVPLAGDELRQAVAWRDRGALPRDRRFTIELRSGPETKFFAAYVVRR